MVVAAAASKRKQEKQTSEGGEPLPRLSAIHSFPVMLHFLCLAQKDARATATKKKSKLSSKFLHLVVFILQPQRGNSLIVISETMTSETFNTSDTDGFTFLCLGYGLQGVLRVSNTPQHFYPTEQDMGLLIGEDL